MDEQKTIKIGARSKLANPCFDAEYGSYNGPISEFAFTDHFTKQFKELQKTLEPYGIQLTTIYSGYKKGHNERNIHNFIALSNDGKFVWRKYESTCPGSGQNYIYIDGNKICNTSWWLYADDGLRKTYLGIES